MLVRNLARQSENPHDYIPLNRHQADDLSAKYDIFLFPTGWLPILSTQRAIINGPAQALGAIRSPGRNNAGKTPNLVGKMIPSPDDMRPGLSWPRLRPPCEAFRSQGVLSLLTATDTSAIFLS